MTNTVKLTAAQFSAELDGLRDLIASVKSARRTEARDEILTLSVRTTAICSIELKRHNEMLIRRRRDLIAYASEVIADRQIALNRGAA